jgi:GNAT superfamily N-acetyltransferase
MDSPAARHEPDSRNAGPGVWYLVRGVLDSRLALITAYADARHPDGHRSDAPSADATESPFVWRTHQTDTGLLRIEVPDSSAPGAPALWFVFVDEPSVRPAAANLVAFATDHFPPGTVVSKFRFATTGVPNEAQAGAVRWYRNGLVHQVFVSESWRRRHVGTVLLHAADAYHQASGWPGHLHGDGRRTRLGERFLATLRHPQRFAPLSDVMPPMDP